MASNPTDPKALILHVGTKHLSSWSMRPFLALVYAGAEFTCRTIPLDRPTTKEAILAVNPTGKVPVLVQGDLVVSDSLAICEYVAELFPHARLWPEKREARARARSISAEMHAGFAALRRDMPMNLVENRPGVGHTPEALADAARVMTIWREALARSGGPFLFGTFTIADAMFAPVATRFQTYGVELDATCRTYVDTVLATSGFERWKREALAERG
ncbi:MAG: glutathione S-transferase family protein [Proteobacteria bacterium]|nr:glutathione S-transferase family protein [Pseudomonadota bacterium]